MICLITGRNKKKLKKWIKQALVKKELKVSQVLEFADSDAIEKWKTGKSDSMAYAEMNKNLQSNT